MPDESSPTIEKRLERMRFNAKGERLAAADRWGIRIWANILDGMWNVRVERDGKDVTGDLSPMTTDEAAKYVIGVLAERGM